MYIVASICKAIAKGESTKHVMTLGAGQGKTLVYILVCLMLARDERTKDSCKTFAVLTTTSTLHEQLSEILRKHALSSRFRVFQQKTFSQLRHHDFDFYVLDEADQLVNQSTLEFDGRSLGGLYLIRDKKQLLCSATFSVFERMIVTEAFGIDELEWLKFETAPEFAAG